MKPLNDVNKGNDVKNQPAEEMKAEPEKIDFSKVKIEPLFEEQVDFDTWLGKALGMRAGPRFLT